MQMKTTFEYKGFVIDLVENTRQHGADRVTNFSWIVRHYGKDVACGRVSDKAAAAEEAQKACDDHLAEPFRYNINLMDGGSVITKDGEYLGTWEADENDHPSFMPDGASEPLFFEMGTGLLCAKIDEWRKESE